MISLVWLLAQAAVPPAAPAAPHPPSSTAVGQWALVERGNAATGTRAVSAAATGPGGRLVVRCDHAPVAVVSVQFIPHEAFRGFGVRPVSLQFDGGTALIDNWELLGAGAVEREEHATTVLTAGIAHARHIALRTADRNGSAIALAFDGPGSEAPIVGVLQACGRVLGQVPASPDAPAAPGPATATVPATAGQ